MEQVILPAMLPPAHKLVKRHQDAGDLTVIITATNRFVTAPIAREFGVEHLIAAEPEVNAEGEITGKTIGTPPYGEGKVVNIRRWLAGMGKSLENFERSTFYSDSQNDIPLLSLVTHPVATNPTAKLTAHAKAHGWPIMTLFDYYIAYPAHFWHQEKKWRASPTSPVRPERTRHRSAACLRQCCARDANPAGSRL